MEEYKSFSSDFQSYREKEAENDNDLELSMELSSIDKLCAGIEISNSLNCLINLTSQPNFRFSKKPPSQIITVIIKKMDDIDISILSLKFLSNVWMTYGCSLEIFVDSELIEKVIELVHNTQDLNIILFGIRAINNLIESTVYDQKCSEFVDNLLDLLFKNGSFQKYFNYLQLQKEEIDVAILRFTFLVTIKCKTQICELITKDPHFLSCIDRDAFPNVQSLAIQVICNLSLNDECFDAIFTPEFIPKFIGFAINIKNIEAIISIFSILVNFLNISLNTFLDNEYLWNSIKDKLIHMSASDLSSIMHFIDSTSRFYPIYLEKYEFWPFIFKNFENFSHQNKEQFAQILCTYFDDDSSLGRPLNVPPLSYAFNGGFEFLCDILDDINEDNTLVFNNIINCLMRLIIMHPAEFGPQIDDTDLINRLETIKLNNSSGYQKKTLHDPGSSIFSPLDDENDINLLITYFLNTIDGIRKVRQLDLDEK